MPKKFWCSVMMTVWSQKYSCKQQNCCTGLKRLFKGENNLTCSGSFHENTHNIKHKDVLLRMHTESISLMFLYTEENVHRGRLTSNVNQILSADPNCQTSLPPLKREGTFPLPIFDLPLLHNHVKFFRMKVVVYL